MKKQENIAIIWSVFIISITLTYLYFFEDISHIFGSWKYIIGYIGTSILLSWLQASQLKKLNQSELYLLKNISQFLGGLIIIVTIPNALFFTGLILCIYLIGYPTARLLGLIVRTYIIAIILVFMVTFFNEKLSFSVLFDNIYSLDGIKNYILGPLLSAKYIYLTLMIQTIILFTQKNRINSIPNKFKDQPNYDIYKRVINFEVVKGIYHAIFVLFFLIFSYLYLDGNQLLPWENLDKVIIQYIVTFLAIERFINYFINKQLKPNEYINSLTRTLDLKIIYVKILEHFKERLKDFYDLFK